MKYLLWILIITFVQYNLVKEEHRHQKIMARSGREYCFLILETEIFEKMIDELKLKLNEF
jgi:hypothetical protein